MNLSDLHTDEAKASYLMFQEIGVLNGKSEEEIDEVWNKYSTNVKNEESARKIIQELS